MYKKRNMMLDNKTKKELKKICDEATLEGLKKILDSKELQSDTDALEFIEYEYNTRKNRILKKLPNYVTNKNYNIDRLVWYICKGDCKQLRWLELQKPFFSIAQVKNAKPLDCPAKCLYCGAISYASYNFSCP